jgi:hypothetical protein
MRYRLAQMWEKRWLIAGGAFLLVGIYTDDVSALAVGLLFLINERIALAEQRTELEILRMETRFQSGATKVHVR